MSQYSGRKTRILEVKTSEIQPGDIILGPPPRSLPSDLRLVSLPRERERDLSIVPPPRPGYLRRTSSLDRDHFPVPYRGRGTTRRRRRRRRDQSNPRDQYDSEGSVPPRSRRAASAKQKLKRRESNPDGKDSEASSSDLGCTDDDEKLKRKTKWKKWASISLAGIATIHAVHGGYETFEKTQARRKELAEGKISDAEAQKKKNNGRWKTAADVGIAAVWIKSAYDEIREYQEVKKEYAEVCEKGEERHRKRLERAKAMEREKNTRHDDDDDSENYLPDYDDDDDY